MVELSDCKTLEEKMFYLGADCAPLPLEPEPINREYYNLGLKIYSQVQDMREIKKLIDLGTRQLAYQSKNNQGYKEMVDETFIKITELYNNITSRLSEKAIPALAKTKVLEHTRFWVNMNYDLIKNVDMRKFNETYNQLVNNKLPINLTEN